MFADELAKTVGLRWAFRLNSLSNSLNGMRGGDLECHGVLLVRYGELEDWLADCGISASKKKYKWAWANEAARYIRENEPRPDDIWDFVRRLGSYLTAQVQ